MEVIQTAIEGVVIIEPRLFNDARGYFFESFSQRDFDRLVRTVHFVQDNESKSSYGVLRGLHLEIPGTPARWCVGYLRTASGIPCILCSDRPCKPAYKGPVQRDRGGI